MGKSSIAVAAKAEQAEQTGPLPKLRCVHFKTAKYISGSQPSIVENKYPFSIRFDFEQRLVFVECSRAGFTETIWVPFEDIQCVRYEPVKDEPTPAA